MGVSNKDRIEEYLNQVCSEIKFRDAHQEVKYELTSHLHELIEEHLVQGFDEKEAVDKAIEKMGSATLVGKQLNQVHKSKPEWSILALCLFFVGLGLFVMYVLDAQGLLFTSLFQKSLIFSVLGACIMLTLYFFDYRKLESYSIYIYWGAMTMMALTYLTGVGKRWLSIGPVHIDFVSISPLLFVIALAGIINNWDWNKKLIKGILLCLAPLLLILMCGSLTAGIVYATASMILLAGSGVGYKVVLAIVGSALFITVLPIINEPHRLSRLTAFYNPNADPTGSGYLNIQLSSLIETSGWLGQGFALEPYILPEIHTDFVFAYIIYTFGWVAGIALASMILLFLIRIIFMVSTVNSGYARLLIWGIGSIFALQFLWNLAMNLGYAPIAAVGLPFISFGGSQLIFNSMAVGVLLSVFRRKSLSNMPVGG